jgi:hypothetical protein
MHFVSTYQLNLAIKLPVLGWLLPQAALLPYKITTTVAMGITTPAHQNESSAIPRSVKKSSIG